MTVSAGAQYRPLGGFRFGLAVLVVLQHFQHLLPPSQRAIFSHMGFGIIAVCAFFAVSGFVVAEANATFYDGRPAAFLANRALRLVPPYIAALALSIAVHAALWHAGRLVLWDYTLHASPLMPARLLAGALALVPGFNAHWLGQDFEFIPFVWTLRLEIAFYLAAACAMAASRRLRARWPIYFAIHAGLAASLAFLLLAGRPGALSAAPMFLMGTCFYLWNARRGCSRGALLLASMAAAGLGFASWQQHGAPVLAWQLALLAAILALFAGLVGRRVGPRIMAADRRLGDLSYPLYLNHYVIGILMTSLAPGSGAVVYVLAVAFAVVVAAATERLVDRHLRQLRARIRMVSL